MKQVEAKIVEVAIGQVKGFFSPTDAERAAAYELLIELTTRPSSAQLATVDATISDELHSIEEMFEITRQILRKHGTDGSKGSGGNLSLAVVALRVLNDVFRPVVNRWRPLLDDHMAQLPSAKGQPTAAEWERRWDRSQQCRTELNSMRASTRAYIETLSHIAGATAIADAILSEPSSTPFPRTSINTSLNPDEDNEPEVKPRQQMVRWLHPKDIWQSWRSLFPAKASLKRAENWTANCQDDLDDKDNRDGEGKGKGKILPTASFRAVADTDFWFDYVADMGDAFDGTAPVAWLLGRHSISLADHRSNEIPTPPASIPRGELLVFGGDQIYPFASADGYESHTELPYRMGLEPDPKPELDDDGNPIAEPEPEPERRPKTEGDPDGNCTDRSPTLLSIPGNHDWMGGIEHYEKMFTTGRGKEPEADSEAEPWRFAGHWQTVQRNTWFHAELPQGWWLWGIDTGLHNTLVGKQEEYFRRAAKSLQPGDRVILCTPVPLWQMRQKHPEEYATLRATFDPIISAHGAIMPLCLSGDTHFFAQFERVDTEVTEDHITAGGGGAFLQPTHNLPERVPLESGNAEFKLTSRWPPSADSRAIAPGAKRVFSGQFVPLMVIMALVYTLYAALERVHIGQMWDVKVANPNYPLQSDKEFVAAESVEQLNWYEALSWGLSWPLPTALLILVAWSGTLIFRGNSVEPKLGKAARVYGFVGGGVISVAFLVVNTTRLDLLHEWSTGEFNRWASWKPYQWSIWKDLLVALGAAVVAGVLSIALFLAVVRWANRKISVNDSLAFLPAQSTRFKNFIRFRIDRDGDLTCFVVGIDPVGKGWYDAMTPKGGAQGSVPPYDPAGSPHIHYIWGKTYEKFNPTPVRLALSISDISPTTEKPAVEKPLIEVFEDLGGALLRGGHSILYGGRPGVGYTDRLHVIEKKTHDKNPEPGPHLFNYVADYLWDVTKNPENPAAEESPVDIAAVESQVDIAAVESPLDIAGEGSPAGSGHLHMIRVVRPEAGEKSDATRGSADLTAMREIADLTAMRQVMTNHADIRVVIGGAMQPDERGTRVAPGIVEEAYLAVEAGLPLVVAGGFGGAAGLIGQAMLGELDPRFVDELAKHFVSPDSLPGSVSFEEMLARFRSTGILRNGLTDGENKELLRSQDRTTVNSLIMRSVHRTGPRRTT